jgi:hypothetical protein
VIEIKITQGYTCIIDEDDKDLAKLKWFYSKGYAVRSVYTKNGRSSKGIHRFIAERIFGNYNSNYQVDHINQNTLDNRRCNLRLSTASENRRNRGKTAKNTSGYKGVTRSNNKWQAQIHTNGKCHYLGMYESLEEAARVYNEAAIRLHGEFASLNEID